MPDVILIQNRREIPKYIIQRNRTALLAIDHNVTHLFLPDYQDILLNPLDCIDKALFDKAYLDAVARLGKAHGSKYWWANSFSEKNEFLSKFYHRLFYYILILKHLSLDKYDRLVILCEDKLLLWFLYTSKQLQGSGVPVSLMVFRLRKLLRNIARFFVKLGALFIREHQRKSLNCKHIIDKELPEKGYFVVRTFVDQRNYRSGRYVDSYYGCLIDYIKKQEKKLVLVAEIIQDYKSNIERIAQDPDNIFVTLEQYFSLSDLLKVIWESIIRHIRFEEKVVFEGQDITALVREEVSESFFSLKFLENLLYYQKTKKAIEHIDCAHFLLPFENYAWEKMTILAAREAQSNVYIKGFLHSFISKNSFRYLWGQEETKFCPVPDKIISIGKRTKDILEHFADTSGVSLIEGCALRQETILRQPTFDRKAFRNVLAALTITVEDTVKFLEFLYQSGLADYPGQIILRFHPLTPRKRVLQQITFTLPRNFVISEEKFLLDDLKRSHVVLYTWTTACLEALKVGLPVIYLDLNTPLVVDPLFEINFLKKAVNSPSQLRPSIDQLTNLEANQFWEDHRKVEEYLAQYFSPIEENALNAFVK